MQAPLVAAGMAMVSLLLVPPGVRQLGFTFDQVTCHLRMANGCAVEAIRPAAPVEIAVADVRIETVTPRLGKPRIYLMTAPLKPKTVALASAD